MQPIQMAPMTAEDRAERKRLLGQAIMRNGTPAQVDLVMAICDRYGLDPLLKHLVLINGAPYVTRDGLLHAAHVSGQFDGIDVEFSRDSDGELIATCTIWRRDMGRPIRYSAYESEHRPTNAGQSAWGKYPRAMLQKCAEVMCLRRAFDVSLGAVEELGYDGIEPSSSLGTVTVLGPGEADMARSRAKEVRGDSGAGGQLEARVSDAAAGADDAGDIADDLGWTDFWTWAKARGLKDRAALDQAAGRATTGMVPAHIARAIMKVEAEAHRAQEVAEPEPEPTPEEQAETILAYFRKGKRGEKREMDGMTKLFSLSEDQDQLEAWRVLAMPLVHQDAIDLAWFDRMNALDRLPPAAATEPEPAAEGEVVEGEVVGYTPDPEIGW